ncbi:olfactory receptor 52D1 [Puntigrus tetrazona]|uniref:olfactory receptor 52D1 n=1 Tax=Puntigrus tetrazona TaxID=1606681 RepID=UPI001C89FD36|nr:olfactory receptor 52D1 [Puntigrus tetrazona]
MENLTYNSIVLQLEGLKGSEQAMYPVFTFFLLFYVIIMVSNIGIFILITSHKSLHEPMYILFCNLPLNDILGNSIMVPRLLMDILKPASERYISYVECVVQAFSTHTYGTTSHTILMIGLTLRLNRCRTFISNPFCDNASLFKLSCEDVTVNNLYGLIYTVLLFGSSMGSIAVTYIKITTVCLITKSKTLNSRALKTCSTHLTLYLIMLISGFIVIVLHRFPVYSDYRKLASLLFHIIPSILNPIIYGLQCSEIRNILIQDPSSPCAHHRVLATGLPVSIATVGGGSLTSPSRL